MATTLVFTSYCLVMVIVHELGHVVAIRLASDAHVRLFVWPGYELYPMWGEPLPGEWPGDGVMVVQPYTAAANVPDARNLPRSAWLKPDHLLDLRQQDGMIRLMGSGSTFLLSVLCLGLLTVHSFGRIARALLSAGALLHVDMLAYTVFPLFFDAPHFYFFGGSEPEPLIGLVEMGLAENVAVGLVVVGSAAQLAWLYYLLKRRRREDLSIRAPSCEAAS